MIVQLLSRGKTNRLGVSISWKMVFYVMLLHKSKLPEILHAAVALKPYAQMLQNVLLWPINIIHIGLKLTKWYQTLRTNIAHPEALTNVQILEELPERHGTHSCEVELLFLDIFVRTFVFKRL